MDTKSWLFFGGVVVIGIAGISRILGRDSMRAQKRKGDEGLKKERNGTKDSKTKWPLNGLRPKKTKDNHEEALKEYIKCLKKKIEVRKIECWSNQRIYFETEAKFRLYKTMFSEEGGILNYVQRLEGLRHYDLDEYKDMQELKIKIGDQLISGLYNTINVKMQKEEESFRFTIPEKFEISMSKEAFINNLNMNTENCNDVKKLEEMFKIIQEKDQYIKQDLEDLEKDANNVRYEALWKNSKASLESLIKYYKCGRLQRVETIDTLCKEIEDIMLPLIKIFSEKDIEFKYYEDLNGKGRENFFIVLDSADNCPAVLRNEKVLLIKGKISRTKITEK